MGWTCMRRWIESLAPVGAIARASGGARAVHSPAPTAAIPIAEPEVRLSLPTAGPNAGANQIPRADRGAKARELIAIIAIDMRDAV